MDLDYEVLLNVVAYSVLVSGLVAWRRQRTMPKPSSPQEAFEMLEQALRHAFPDMKDGFTWREELFRARRLKPDLGWDSIEQDLKAYEMYRYGRDSPPGMVGTEFLNLVRVLRGVRPRR